MLPGCPPGGSGVDDLPGPLHPPPLTRAPLHPPLLNAWTGTQGHPPGDGCTPPARLHAGAPPSSGTLSNQGFLGLGLAPSGLGVPIERYFPLHCSGLLLGIGGWRRGSSVAVNETGGPVVRSGSLPCQGIRWNFLQDLHAEVTSVLRGGGIAEGTGTGIGGVP